MTVALGGLATFTAWLVKTFITHLESDLAYSRKGHQRGTATAEKAVAVVEQKAE